MASDFANTVRSKYRELQRSAEDKVLIEQGIVDREGDLRKEGRFAILQHLFDQDANGVKAHLVAMAKAVSEDEAKKRKTT